MVERDPGAAASVKAGANLTEAYDALRNREGGLPAAPPRKQVALDQTEQDVVEVWHEIEAEYGFQVAAHQIRKLVVEWIDRSFEIEDIPETREVSAEGREPVWAETPENAAARLERIAAYRHLREVVMLLDPDEYERYGADVRALRKSYGTSGVQATVLRCIREAAEKLENAASGDRRCRASRALG